jgi:hypothetical protein
MSDENQVPDNGGEGKGKKEPLPEPKEGHRVEKAIELPEPKKGHRIMEAKEVPERREEEPAQATEEE